VAAKEKLVIANCGGFWGDDPTAARRQVEGGPIDYLVMDYLAEVTMAILQKQRLKRPEAGFAGDFLLQLRDVLPACVEKGITVISNAGGVNPLACRDAVVALAEAAPERRDPRPGVRFVRGQPTGFGHLGRDAIENGLKRTAALERCGDFRDVGSREGVERLHALTPEPKEIVILEGAHVDGRRPETVARLTAIVREWLTRYGALNE